jgi:hypothetical protein
MRTFDRRVVVALVVIGNVLLASLWANKGAAQDLGSIDGVWEGTLDWVHAPGLQTRENPAQVWRIVLQGNTAKMFIVRDGKLEEVYPGTWKVERLETNVLIHAIASGGSRGDRWINSMSFNLLKRDRDTLGVVRSGAVNNAGTPLTSDISKYFAVQTGNFHRVP